MLHCRKLEITKCWNQLVGNFDTFLLAKIKFISNFYLRYCKDIANLLFWKFWECLTIPIKIHSIGLQGTCRKLQTCYFGQFEYAWPHTPKMIISIWRNLWYLFAGKKSSSFKFYLRYCKVIILSTLSMPGYPQPRWYYQLAENFCVYLQPKINFIPHVFLEILQKYANSMSWVLWASLVTHIQNDSTNL